MQQQGCRYYAYLLAARPALPAADATASPKCAKAVRAKPAKQSPPRAAGRCPRVLVLHGWCVPGYQILVTKPARGQDGPNLERTLKKTVKKLESADAAHCEDSVCVCPHPSVLCCALQ